MATGRQRRRPRQRAGAKGCSVTVKRKGATRRYEFVPSAGVSRFFNGTIIHTPSIMLSMKSPTRQPCDYACFFEDPGTRSEEERNPKVRQKKRSESQS